MDLNTINGSARDGTASANPTNHPWNSLVSMDRDNPQMACNISGTWLKLKRSSILMRGPASR